MKHWTADSIVAHVVEKTEREVLRSLSSKWDHMDLDPLGKPSKRREKRRNRKKELEEDDDA